MAIPRILIAAPRSGSGKTLVTCSLLEVWKRKYSLAAFKCGPDYIDPMFHKEILGVDSRNLDSFLCGEAQIKELFRKHCRGKELAVLEGVMGYYDGLGGTSLEASTYEIARITDTPVILVVDSQGASRSLLPLIAGFLGYREDSHIAGIIFNRMSPSFYPVMKKLVEEELGIRVYGYLEKLVGELPESRHLGLKMPQEYRTLQETLKELGKKAETTIDTAGLMALAGEWAEKTKKTFFPALKRAGSFKGNLRIGVARDEAFCFIYQDNLEYLEELGATLVDVSPMRDPALPKDLDGLVLYGGYPELHGPALEANESLRKEIKEKLEQGLPCMAECGGFMYLTEAIMDQEGNRWEMVGAISGDSFFTGKLRRFGYAVLDEARIFGEKIRNLPFHEFHYFDSEDPGGDCLARKPLSARTYPCMVSRDSLFAGYPHFHYWSQSGMAEAFVNACGRYHRKKGEAEIQ